MKILLNGYHGQMGQAVQTLADSPSLELVPGTADTAQLPSLLADCDLAIDFSLHHATVGLVAAAAALGKPVVIGTTGHNEAEREAVLAFTGDIPIVWAGNFSVGINLLLYLTEQVAAVLSEDYHPEIVEMHHLRKKDAPSGTARELVQAVLRGRNWQADDVRYGRNGITGARPNQEVGVHALRGGTVVGEHTVLFAGPNERLELKHQAADRAIFAQGAIRAAHWVLGRKPGLYGMREVLGL